MNRRKEIACIVFWFGMVGLVFNISVIVNHRVSFIYHYFLNATIILFDSVIGVLIYCLKKYRLCNSFLIIISLFLIDQLSKLILLKTCTLHFPLWLLTDWLYIDPQFNPYGSYIGSVFHAEIPCLVFFEFVLLFAIVFLYRFLLIEAKADTFWISAFFILSFAGAVSSFTDTVVFGSSYDFLTLNGMVKFDFKDLYIWLSRPCLIIALISDRSIKDALRILKNASLGKFVRHEWIVIHKKITRKSKCS